MSYTTAEVHSAGLGPMTLSLTSTPSRYLVASPYADAGHLLDLDTLDKESELLARALTHMANTRSDYAIAGYVESFNWEDVLAELKLLVEEDGHQWRAVDFYIVAFRSQIPPTTVYADLGVLDAAAHLEAVKSGGLLK